MPYVLAGLAGRWISYCLAHVFARLAKRTLQAAVDTRQAIARKLSSPKDLSHFDLTPRHRPNWKRNNNNVSSEKRPLNLASPDFDSGFTPARSQYASVTLVDSDESQ